MISVVTKTDSAADPQIMQDADIKIPMMYAHLSKEFAKEEIQLMNGLTSQIKKAIDAESTALNLSCYKTVTKSDSVKAANR